MSCLYGVLLRLRLCLRLGLGLGRRRQRGWQTGWLCVSGAESGRGGRVRSVRSVRVKGVRCVGIVRHGRVRCMCVRID